MCSCLTLVCWTCVCSTADSATLFISGGVFQELKSKFQELQETKDKDEKGFEEQMKVSTIPFLFRRPRRSMVNSLCISTMICCGACTILYRALKALPCFTGGPLVCGVAVS